MANPESPPSPSPVKAGHLPAVKAGGMRVSKKLENAPVERSSKFPGKEKASCTPVIKVQSMNILLTDTFEKRKRCSFPLQGHQKPFPESYGQHDIAERYYFPSEMLRHTFPANAMPGAYEKPRPTLEKIVLPKRVCIIQQPRKC
ncbi:death-associated protein-like 1 isoform X1 [Erythrolamprus reginae]|uniref:death-associated protein-like 1 isoform X1 n=1 Tax=Erythrolamprus reginae TaxID=121349 RepID=UPI00396D00F7